MEASVKRSRFLFLYVALPVKLANTKVHQSRHDEDEDEEDEEEEEYDDDYDDHDDHDDDDDDDDDGEIVGAGIQGCRV